MCVCVCVDGWVWVWVFEIHSNTHAHPHKHTYTHSYTRLPWCEEYHLKTSVELKYKNNTREATIYSRHSGTISEFVGNWSWLTIFDPFVNKT